MLTVISYGNAPNRFILSGSGHFHISYSVGVCFISAVIGAAADILIVVNAFGLLKRYLEL